MRLAFRSVLLAAALLLPSLQALAADDTPVGAWTQVDDETGKPKSIIDISTAPDGTLQGVVKQVLFSEQGTTNPICKECDGERHNQPITGMTIMWGVTKDGDQWSGGQILDPKNGKTYKVRLKLVEGGRKLDVHGYIGFSLLGRSQVWERKTD